MAQRGKKSAASLAVISGSQPGRLRPPTHLSDEAARLFRLLVTACDPDHFVASDAPLLCSYCEATALARQAAEALEEEGPVVGGRVNPWLAVREKATREQVALSMRLRLAPQSRLKAEAVGRKPGSRQINYVELVRGQQDAD
jgi:P27 family predicted phage terminase small subunit